MDVTLSSTVCPLSLSPFSYSRHVYRKLSFRREHFGSDEEYDQFLEARESLCYGGLTEPREQFLRNLAQAASRFTTKTTEHAAEATEAHDAEEEKLVHLRHDFAQKGQDIRKIAGEKGTGVSEMAALEVPEEQEEDLDTAAPIDNTALTEIEVNHSLPVSMVAGNHALMRSSMAHIMRLTQTKTRRPVKRPMRTRVKEERSAAVHVKRERVSMHDRPEGLDARADDELDDY
ncbi:hypothetical protein KIPB_006102 [Kipferlia bialata]|uniref:Uncharacterized protein n=1 Tax=Kipferlia bialata TaxID=797122 RepID=A0A9K3CYV3_9EUKA|nr:hypothetical protein KIPB_006102 [Kipferlia bialata]|eukprot:g6102.t1